MNDELSIGPREKAWVAYISPFRIVVPDGEKPLNVSLEEINANTYNHGNLCRIVGATEISVESKLKMIICYDGALAVPAINNFQLRESAIEYFNKVMCQLLIGGLACEALDTRDVVWGQLHEKSMIWPVDLGESASSQQHAKLRMRMGNGMDTIILSNPRKIQYSDLLLALSNGAAVLKEIENLTPEFLIRGYTELSYRNWSQALSSLWISIEQLTDHLWKKRFVISEAYKPSVLINGREKALREDSRTWSSSVKQEILFQSKLISEEIFGKLYPARQARNRLVHDGKSVEESIALGAYDALIDMLCLCSGKSSLPIQSVKILRREKDMGQKRPPEFTNWEDISEQN